jgi:predicted O-linked N-acetylglucosamine transferase (SPINDLY family)
MTTVSEALAIGLRHHQAGRLPAAEQVYRQILDAEPSQVDALHLLGVLASQMGKHATAVEYIRRAIALAGTEAPFHNNLGTALQALGRLDEAVASYRRSLELRPDYADAHYNLGTALQAQGQLDEAAACYRRALELQPGSAAAHYNLGNVFRKQGKPDEAVGCYRRALELRPDHADAHYKLGTVLQARGKPDEAVACYRQALQLKPGDAVAHNNLGTTLQAQGQLDEAAACYRRALELNPGYAAALNNLGTTLQAQGQLGAAVACYRRALELQPSDAVALSNLGNAYQVQGQLDEAVACYRRALEIKPDYIDALSNLGNALHSRKQLDEAVVCLRRAVALKPDHVDALNNLGNALQVQGHLDEAVACYRRALRVKPDFAAAHYNLGNASQEQGKLDEAIASFGRALALKPDYVDALNNLGNALQAQGQLDEAVACYHRALALKPDLAAGHSNLLFTLQYRADATLSGLAQAHAEYERQHATPLRAAWRPHENVRDPHRRLRLGFVSPDFHRHPVAFFLIRAVENLDRGQCDVACYNDRLMQDDLTARFRGAATTWRDVAGWSDNELAEAIIADRIDILFDLAGHTAGNRLLAFARKPAPIQITWIGYEGTTGLGAIDYILADRYTIPPGQEAGYRERVLRMPDGYVCYDPPATAPEVGSLPAAQTGSICFGSFNRLAKITPQVVAVWAQILRRVPHSRLLLKYRGLGDESVRRRYLDRFTAQNVDPRRLELAPPSSHAEYLAAYRQVDVALDPFPFGGGATTCEALWMGVPVVICPGETFASRHGLSHLANVGLTETVARDLDEYIELAASLAGDRPRLAALRAGLRQRVAASPLCDGKRFAGHLMTLLREVWQQWIARG